MTRAARPIVPGRVAQAERGAVLQDRPTFPEIARYFLSHLSCARATRPPQAGTGRAVAPFLRRGYLPGKGSDSSVLIDGVGVDRPGAMAGAIVAQDTRVMSH